MSTACPCSPVVKALQCHVLYSVTHSRFKGFKVHTSAQCTSAYQRIISYNSYAHDEQGDDPWQKGFNGALYLLRPLLTPWLAASMLLATLVWAEVNRLRWPLAGVAHSTGQG